jgi:hypothetical protein
VLQYEKTAQGLLQLGAFPVVPLALRAIPVAVSGTIVANGILGQLQFALVNGGASLGAESAHLLGISLGFGCRVEVPPGDSVAQGYRAPPQAHKTFLQY